MVRISPWYCGSKESNGKRWMFLDRKKRGADITDLGAFALQRLDTRLTYIFYISTILLIHILIFLPLRSLPRGGKT